MTVYRNANVVRLDPPLVEHGVDIVEEGGLILEAGAGTASRRGRGEETVDLAGAWVLPGLICSHAHVYSALARGLTVPVAPSSSFVEQLEHLWWRLDRAVDEQILRSSALVAALEAISCGTTTLVDHHASPSFIRGSLSVIRDSFARVGLRSVLCYETTDRNGASGACEGIDENLAFARELELERGRLSGVPLVEACIGAHAPFTLSDETLERLGGAVRESGRGLHIHVAEDSYDASYAHHHSRTDVLARLDGFGLLGPRAILAHGVHLAPVDLELLDSSGAFLVHNPRSNMNNSVGYARHLTGLRNVALGTDGLGADMFGEACSAFLKAHDAGLPWGASEAVRLLAGGNELAGRAFGARFGRIDPGCVADFVVLDYDPPTPLTAENLASHLAFGVGSRHVRTVVVGGKRVYTDRRFPLDVAEIHADARAQARRLWDRMRDL